jgi:hypothetical protein
MASSPSSSFDEVLKSRSLSLPKKDMGFPRLRLSQVMLWREDAKAQGRGLAGGAALWQPRCMRTLLLLACLATPAFAQEAVTAEEFEEW